MLVHLYGRCADLPAWQAWAQDHGLYLIEDVAQAHDAAWAGRKAGSAGSIGAFSFFPTKNLSAVGEAGAVVTSDGRIANKVRRILRISQEPMSLDTPVGNEENSSLGDFIEDDTVPGPVEVASGELLREQVHSALDQLTERGRDVLEMRFGLRDGQAHTLEEVGQAFGVTRERIRQIEAKALRKLRHPVRSRKLRDYLGG